MSLVWYKKLIACCFSSCSASKLERERIEHEKIQQKRIDESITSALADKCIIIEEEEEVIDEFLPLNEQQLRFVNFALHGSRSEVRSPLIVLFYRQYPQICFYYY